MCLPVSFAFNILLVSVINHEILQQHQFGFRIIKLEIINATMRPATYKRTAMWVVSNLEKSSLAGRLFNYVKYKYTTHTNCKQNTTIQNLLLHSSFEKLLLFAFVCWTLALSYLKRATLREKRVQGTRLVCRRVWRIARLSSHKCSISARHALKCQRHANKSCFIN